MPYPHLRIPGTGGASGWAVDPRPMRRKLLLTVALAVLGTAVTAAVVNGQVQEPPERRRRHPTTKARRPGSLRPARTSRTTTATAWSTSPTPAAPTPSDGDESNPAPPPPPPPRRTAAAAVAAAAPRAAAAGGTGGGGGGRLHRRRRRSRAGRSRRIGRARSRPGTAAAARRAALIAGGKPAEPPTRTPDGVPTNANPTLTIADFGPAPIGVPSFLIDQFTIPPFLLAIYQACGTQYGIPWEVLAAINRIETAFGTNLNVSTAGAVGWMQFLPSTWEAVRGGRQRGPPQGSLQPGRRDLRRGALPARRPAARRTCGSAIFAYNHADWYVDEVLLYASQYGKLPEDLVGSLIGLTHGARFPVAAKARYADDISERRAAKRAKPRKGSSGNVADVVSSSPTRRGINIYSHKGAPVVAVNDGTIKRVGHNSKLGNFIVLQDTYGNRFTYAQLGRVSKVYPVPKQHKLSASDFKLVTPKKDKAPTQPATRGKRVARPRGQEQGQRRAP